MFEQMFNISPQFTATLSLSLDHLLETRNLNTFLSAALSLCSSELRFYLSGGCFAYSRHANAKTTTRQFPRLFSPLLCQRSGASPASRRILHPKSDNPAPTSRFPAIRTAGIFAFRTTLMNTVIFHFNPLVRPFRNFVLRTALTLHFELVFLSPKSCVLSPLPRTRLRSTFPYLLQTPPTCAVTRRVCCTKWAKQRSINGVARGK
jgi:hypothetical protein